MPGPSFPCYWRWGAFALPRVADIFNHSCSASVSYNFLFLIANSAVMRSTTSICSGTTSNFRAVLWQGHPPLIGWDLCWTSFSPTSLVYQGVLCCAVDILISPGESSCSMGVALRCLLFLTCVMLVPSRKTWETFSRTTLLGSSDLSSSNVLLVFV